MRDPFTIDLMAEFDVAVTQRTADHDRHLKGYGVTPQAIEDAGGLGIQRIVPVGRTYTPDPTGCPAVILGVWYPSPYAVDCQPLIFDLVAFKPCDPFVWWLRRGFEGLELGPWWHDWALDTGEPIRHFASPLAWLQAGTEGTCNLDIAAAWAVKNCSSSGRYFEVAA